MTSKGYYNYNDLNRIEEWCEFLATKLATDGYVINITTKTNWTVSDFPTYSEMERIRTNIKAIMIGFTYITQIYDAADAINYARANLYEKILYEIDTMLISLENNYIYSGVANAGQNRIWQHRFRKQHAYFNTWNDLVEIYWSDFEENETWNGVIFKEPNT